MIPPIDRAGKPLGVGVLAEYCTSGNERPQLQEGQRARQPASGGRSIEKPNDHRRHREADTHCAAKHHHEISKQACSDSSLHYPHSVRPRPRGFSLVERVVVIASFSGRQKE